MCDRGLKLKKIDFYIDGKWVTPLGTETVDVINPATEQAVAEISLGNSMDVDRAVTCS